MEALPLDIIHNILSYNRNFVVRKGKLYTIKRLDVSKYKLDIASKKYVTKSYLLTYQCHYGFFIQFKNKCHRMYYKEGDEIEIVFESIYQNEDNIIIFWQSHFIE